MANVKRSTYQVYIPARLRAMAEELDGGKEGDVSFSKFVVKILEQKSAEEKGEGR